MARLIFEPFFVSGIQSLQTSPGVAFPTVSPMMPGEPEHPALLAVSPHAGQGIKTSSRPAHASNHLHLEQ